MSFFHPYPPLITARSPSYERARQELAHPSPAGEGAVIAVLDRLYEAEENARAACMAAAQVVDPLNLAEELEEAADAHAERRDALAGLVAAHGGLPPRPAEVRQLLTHGEDSVRHWVLADGVLDVDDAVVRQLTAMRRELSALYAEAIGDPNLDDAQRAALRQLVPG